jgi:hypothetical protein
MQGQGGVSNSEGAKMGAPAPEDVVLGQLLDARLQGASEAVKHHRAELRRAERVAAACRAGLDALQADQKQPADFDESERSAY